MTAMQYIYTRFLTQTYKKQKLHCHLTTRLNNKNTHEFNYDQFEKTIVTYRQYVHSAIVHDYSYELAENARLIPANLNCQCSSVRFNQFHARNFDYEYNDKSEFIIWTPSNADRCKTMAICLSEAFSDEDVINRTEQFVNNAWTLPFYVVDGINQYGVVINANTVPLGDNPNTPMILRDHWNVDTFNDNWNRTYTTHPNKPRRSLMFLARTVLDYSKSVDDAIRIINQYDWHTDFGKSGSKLDGNEYHFMISDSDKTVIVEFIQNEYKISDISVLEYNSSLNYMRSVNDTIVRPIMTNFYIANWNGITDDFQCLPINNTTLTRYSVGLERYYYLNEHYDSDLNDSTTISDMLNYIGEVNCDRIYQNNNAYSNIWNSEFSECRQLSNDMKQFEIRYGYNISLNTYGDYAKAHCDNYHNKHDLSSIRDGSCMHTINQSVYDIINRQLLVKFQQSDETYCFKLNSII